MNFLKTDLECIPWLDHGFFTRSGGVSGGIYTSLNCGVKTGDEPEHTKTNRAKVAETLALPPGHLVIARQTHGARAVQVKTPWSIDNAPEADALVTAERGIGLGVLTADCAPVLLVAKKERIIGAAHAGWRGALGGIMESTVEAMKKLGARVENIEAAIGPCIGPDSYEVRDDFKTTFLARNQANKKFFQPSPRPGRLLFNLPGYVSSRLLSLGVKVIYDVKQDTLTNGTEFFSNRRSFLKSEKGFGLQLSVIAIKN